MATRKKADKPAIEPERLAEIIADARSGINWASQLNYGPACLCGHPKKAKCYRHGTAQADPAEDDQR